MKDSGKQENRECLLWTIGVVLFIAGMVVAAVNIIRGVKNILQ